MRMRRPDGSFTMHEGGEEDVRYDLADCQHGVMCFDNVAVGFCCVGDATPLCRVHAFWDC